MLIFNTISFQEHFSRPLLLLLIFYLVYTTILHNKEGSGRILGILSRKFVNVSDLRNSRKNQSQEKLTDVLTT